jgi:hypothetical protein
MQFVVVNSIEKSISKSIKDLLSESFRDFQLKVDPFRVQKRKFTLFEFSRFYETQIIYSS